MGRMRGWAELVTELTKKKNMTESMRWTRKIGEGILGPKQKRKKEIKTGKDFWATKNLKFDSNDF
jgi:hypothetical protein